MSAHQHQPTQRAAAAPRFADPVLLVTFPRGRNVEVRLELGGVIGDDGQARHFLSLREWQIGHDGIVRPSPRGITIRRNELGRTIGALVRAAALLGLDVAADLAGEKGRAG